MAIFAMPKMMQKELFQLLLRDASDIIVKSFLEGGTVTKNVDHRHLLPLLAVHSSDLEPLMLLYPKCTYGTLKHVLLQSRGRSCDNSLYIGMLELVRMAEQTSRGMYHLNRKGFTHKDLGARSTREPPHQNWR